MVGPVVTEFAGWAPEKGLDREDSRILGPLSGLLPSRLQTTFIPTNSREKKHGIVSASRH